MENHPVEEERYTKLRQTIRSVILPLVQAIYNEDPTDVIPFCLDYFDGLLRHRGNEKNAGETNGKTEVGGIREALQTMNAPSSNVQGSASEPILTGDKQCENLSLRETSSWNLTSNPSRSTGAFLGYNIADILSRIGDQACSTEEKEESLQCDAKSGDANVSLKELTLKTLAHETDIENDTPVQIIQGPIIQGSQNTYVLPSAPPEENFQELSSEVKSNSDHRDLRCKNDVIQTLNIQEGKTNDVSESLKPDVPSSPTTDQNSIPVGENKASNKQLSPNSSFGFVPHLSQPEENMRRGNSQCYNEISYIRKDSEEMEELTKRLSGTLQSLAQEFSSAETNFNETFQNVKEISDVVQGQHGTKEMNENSRFTQGSDRDNEAVNRRKELNENSNSVQRYLHEVRDENNNLVNDTSESKFKKSSEQQQMNKEQSDSVLLQDDRKEDGKFDNHESRQTLDESWRSRWYESHPRLDLDSRQNNPRFFRGHHLFNANRSSEVRHNIGEGGDVPSDRFFTADGDLNGNLASSLDSSHVGRSTRTSGGKNAYPSYSGDEVWRRNIGRVSRNFPDRELPTHISQNIPYSWRQMCKPSVRSLESEEKRVKQPQMKDGKDSENDTKRDLNENVPEVIVVKTIEGKAKIDSLNGGQNTSSSKTVENKEDGDYYQQARNYWENMNRMDTDNENLPRVSFYQRESRTYNHSDDGKNETKLKPQQATNDDSCTKKGMEMVNDNGDTSLINKEVSEPQRSESVEKVEPGLISAGGDFVVNEEDGQVNPSGGAREENGANNQNQTPPSGITAEYLQEIMGRVMEQQEEDFKDTLESINFSSYSESDKSSDYSETE